MQRNGRLKTDKLPNHEEIIVAPSLRHSPINLIVFASFARYSAPYLSCDSFGRQDLHPPRVDFHHMHDGISEDDTPQLLIRGNLCFDIVLRSCNGTLVLPQHNQAACVRQRARRDTPYWSLDWCCICTKGVILSACCLLWLCFPFAWLRGR